MMTWRPTAGRRRARRKFDGLLAAAVAWLVAGSLAWVPSAPAQDWGLRRGEKPSSAVKGKGAAKGKDARKGKAPRSKSTSRAGAGSESGGPGGERAALEAALSRLVASPTDDDALRGVLAGAYLEPGGAPALAARLVGQAPATNGDGGDGSAKVEPTAASANAWAAAGRIWDAAREPARALEAYDRAISGGAGGSWLRVARGRVLDLLGRPADAAADYELAAQGAQSELDRAEWSIAAARAWVASDQPERGKEALRRWEREQRSGASRAAVADAFAQLGWYEDALERWQTQAGASDRRTAALALVEMAAIREAQGRIDEAISLLDDAVGRAAGGSDLEAELAERQVDLYRRAGRLQQWAAVLASKPNKRYEDWFSLSSIHDELGQEADALAALEEALSRRPRSEEAHRARAALLRRSGSADEVVAAYRELARVTRGAADVRLELADVLHQRGRQADALAEVDAVARSHRRDADVLTQVTERLLQFGAPPTEVEPVLVRLRQLEPRNEGHILNLGELYYSQGDEARAAKVWGKLLDVMADRADAHFLLAQTQASHGMRDDAMGQFEQALRLAPERLEIRRAFARMLEEARRYGPALAQWRSLLQLCGGDSYCASEARAELIALLRKTGDLERQRVRLSSLFAGEPPDRDAGRLLLAIEASEGRWGEAAEVGRRLVETGPSDVEALVALELVYARLNDPVQAAALARRAAELDPRDRAVHLARAADYELAGGDAGDALTTAKRLVRLRPTEPQSRARLGDVLWQLGRPDEAVEAYREAVRLGSREADVLVRLAAVLRQQGRLNEERELLETVVTARQPVPGLLRLGRDYVEVAERTGQLERAERVIFPLALDAVRGGLHRQLYVDVVHRLARSLAGPAEPTDSAAAQVQRVAARRELGARALKPLMDALGADDYTTQTQVLDALVVLRPVGAVRPLQRLVEGRDEGLAMSAMVVLAHIGDSAGVPVLTRAVRDRKDAARHVAVWALGAQRGEAAAKAMVSILPSLTHTAERAFAALALGVMGMELQDSPSASSVDAALASLRQSTDEVVRVAALVGLGAARSDSVVQLAADSTLHGSPIERQMAAWALGRRGGDALVGLAMRSVLAGDADQQLTAAWALVEAGREDSTQSDQLLREHYLSLAPTRRPELLSLGGMTRLAGSTEPITAEAASRAVLAHLDTLRAVLPGVLVEGSPDRQTRTLQALGGARGAPHVHLGPLLQECPDEHPQCVRARGALAAVLAEQQARWLEWATVGDANRRAASLYLLSRLDDSSLGSASSGSVSRESSNAARGQAIRAALVYDDPVVRAAGASAAQSLRMTGVQAELVACADASQPWYVRSAALSALREVAPYAEPSGDGQSAAIQVARSAMQSEYVSVRASGVEYAGAVLPTFALVAEFQGLSRDEESVVRRAIDALARRPEPDAQKLLRTWRQELPAAYWPQLDEASPPTS